MSQDEMRVRVEDYGADEDFEFDLPDCDFCDDRGCEECHPDDFAQMNLRWICDGSQTIEEALEALQEFTDDLRNYQNDGFELSEPVDNAYFWLEKTKSSSPS